MPMLAHACSVHQLQLNITNCGPFDDKGPRSRSVVMAVWHGLLVGSLAFGWPFLSFRLVLWACDGPLDFCLVFFIFGPLDFGPFDLLVVTVTFAVAGHLAGPFEF